MTLENEVDAMRRQRMEILTVCVLLLGLYVPALPGQTTQQSAREPFRFEVYTQAEGVPMERVAVAAAALGFQSWQRPAERFVAPRVNRELLLNPERSGPAVRTCNVVRFEGEPWGHCQWSWRLPGAPTGSAGNWLDVEITLTPSARAAQEVLLVGMTENMLPTEALATTYSALDSEDLGEAAFVVTSRAGDAMTVRFARANLAVRVQGSGALAAEVLTVARRLDGRILDQQPLTEKQLLDRRPTVTLEARVDASRGVVYRSVVPGNRKVVAVQGFVQGQPVAAANGRLLVGERQGAVEAEVLTITQDLLVGSARGTVQVGG